MEKMQFEQLLDMANNGDPVAQYNVAKCYAHGKYVEANMTKA